MDASHWTVAIVGVLAGAIPALGKFIIDVLRGRSSIGIDERRALFEEAQQLRADMAAEIVSLRDRVTELHNINVKLAVENGELRVTVRELNEDIIQLRNQLDMLDRKFHGEADGKS